MEYLGGTAHGGEAPVTAVQASQVSLHSTLLSAAWSQRPSCAAEYELGGEEGRVTMTKREVQFLWLGLVFGFLFGVVATVIGVLHVFGRTHAAPRTDAAYSSSLVSPKHANALGNWGFA